MSSSTDTNADAELMACYDITCVMVPQYQYQTWRYSKLSDAVAQAKRIGAASSAVG